MGGFAIPTLPSLPSVRSFINNSPPLVYPSTVTPKKKSTDDDTPTRPRRRSVSGANSLLPSPSIADVPKEWESISRHRRGSSSSLRGDEIAAVVSDMRGRSNAASPVRPSHRRAQSAAPRRANGGNLGGMRDQGPLGRLQEISRNPLASASAISLPTLCELGTDQPDQNYTVRDPDQESQSGSVPASPITFSRPRRLSQATAIRGTDKPTRPLSRSSSLKHSSSSRSAHTVPPPNTMGPPPLVRPCPSPRYHSAQDVRPTSVAQSFLGRRSSLSSTSSLSDVAVLATWSFPESPESHLQETSLERPSDRLRDRLKSLSELDTSYPVSGPSSGGTTPNLRSPLDTPRHKLGRSNTTSALRDSAHGHRHTHSSPNVIPLHPVSLSGPSHHTLSGPMRPLLPPPRPQRRPTTSRLRQPNPLSMPIEYTSQQGPGGSNLTNLSCSPGSMISDTRSTSSDGELPSPASSVVSLPPVPIPMPLSTSEKGFKWNHWRRGSVSSIKSDKSKRQGVERINELEVKLRGSGYEPGPRDGEEGSSEEEQYLTLDDI